MITAGITQPSTKRSVVQSKVVGARVSRQKVRKMTKLLKIFLGVVLLTFVFLGGTAVASNSNDHVLHEDRYDEYFKQEGRGDKNYLYTRTEIPAPKPGKCVVVTGASETSVALFCNTKDQ